VRTIPIVARYALQESLRRRVFVVVLIITAGFLTLYGFGVDQTMQEIEGRFSENQFRLEDRRLVAGATLVGLSMFATLFLGTVLAIFLTLGAVRGDADRGLLQPIIVRPVGRGELLVGRFLSAIAVTTFYVGIVYTAAVIITGTITQWWPDRLITPALALAAAVAIIAALSLLGSVFLSTTANGIAVFMVFGAGLVSGLLGQIGDALGSTTLEDSSRIAAWALPFEALYQAGLHELTTGVTGAAGVFVQLGPFGGSRPGSATLVLWAVMFLGLVGAAALALFRRRDL
jgi:Cu-processing system permease protein